MLRDVYAVSSLKTALDVINDHLNADSLSKQYYDSVIVSNVRYLLGYHIKSLQGKVWKHKGVLKMLSWMDTSTGRYMPADMKAAATQRLVHPHPVIVTFMLKLETLVQREYLNPTKALALYSELFITMQRELAVSPVLRQLWAKVTAKCNEELVAADEEPISAKDSVLVLEHLVIKYLNSKQKTWRLGTGTVPEAMNSEAIRTALKANRAASNSEFTERAARMCHVTRESFQATADMLSDKLEAEGQEMIAKLQAAGAVAVRRNLLKAHGSQVAAGAPVHADSSSDDDDTDGGGGSGGGSSDDGDSDDADESFGLGFKRTDEEQPGPREVKPYRLVLHNKHHGLKFEAIEASELPTWVKEDGKPMPCRITEVVNTPSSDNAVTMKGVGGVGVGDFVVTVHRYSKQQGKKGEVSGRSMPPTYLLDDNVQYPLVLLVVRREHLLISGMGLVAVRVGAEAAAAAAAAAAARQHATPQRKGKAHNGDGTHPPSSSKRKAVAASRQPGGSLRDKQGNKGPKKVRFSIIDDGSEPKRRTQGTNAKSKRRRTGLEAGDETGGDTGDDEAVGSAGERATAHTMSLLRTFHAPSLAVASVNDVPCQ